MENGRFGTLPVPDANRCLETPSQQFTHLDRVPWWRDGAQGLMLHEYLFIWRLGPLAVNMSIIVCHACDLVHRRSEVAAERTRVRCVRCRAELYRTHSTSMDTAIAVALSAMVLLVLSNVYPMVTLELNGSKRTATLMRAVWDMYLQGYVPVAFLVLLTTVLIPLFQISALLYLLISLRMNRGGPRAIGRPPIAGRNELFRALGRLRPWAMSEVFMLGALVAMVKLSATATVVPGISLFSYGALMLMLATLTAITPAEQFWQWVEESSA
jgi:paraquat-inducible protein A